MIASYRHNFIFIKTIKTAGTSVEFALSQHCGPEDIVAPIGPGEDVARAAGGILPRNFSRDPDFELRYQRSAHKGRRKLLRAQFDHAGLGKHRFCTNTVITCHANAGDVLSWVKPEFWDRAIRFTAERHPYEKAVSLAFHDMQTTDDFAKRLDETVRQGARYPGWPFYTLNNRVAVHYFVRHDRLHSDLAAIAAKLKLPQIDLPQRRADVRTDRRPAAEILTQEQKRIVYEFCAREFDLFGWER